MFIYIVFTIKGKTLQVASVDEARQLILHRFPGAHFGRWSETKGKSKLTVWPSADAEEEYEGGDTSDRFKPRAYIVVQQHEMKTH